MAMRWATILLAATVLAACGDKTAEGPAPASAQTARPAAVTVSPMKAYTAGVTRIADAIGTIKDEATAKSAAATIAAANADLAAEVKRIDAMNDADRAAAAMTNMQELVAAQQKIAIAMSNMAMNNPALMRIVADELGKMPQLNN